MTVALPGAALAQGGKPAARAAAATPANSTETRWTAETPDEMAKLALDRARAGGDDALAALVVAASLDERASYGLVRDGLRAIASSSSPLADDARWLALRLTPTPPATPWPGVRRVQYDTPPDPDGLVHAFALLGPFQDTGGGLLRREGPEEPGQSWSDPRATYSWGVYEVAWRRVLPSTVTARGLPLDLYVHPRSESCTYLGARVALPPGERAKAVVVHVAAGGAVRLMWDQADVAASEDIHPRLVLDRMAARIEMAPGDHLLGLKVCTGSVADDGRVRVRFTDEQEHPIAIAASSDLRPLHAATKPLAGAKQPGVARKAPKGGAHAADAKPAATAPKPALVPPAGAPAIDAPAAGASARGPRDAAPKSGDVAPKSGDIAPGSPSKPGARDRSPANAMDGGPGAPTAPGGDSAQPASPAPGAPAGPRGASAAPHTRSAAETIKPPPGVTRVRTALERALEIGASPTIPQALRVGILRTLGGADDARSPRAPGLLDRVARDPAASPDALAMAGWVSPFGANRSGWLNLARTRAHAASDRATESFATRRLAASHLGSQFAEWAIDITREEPLRSATDPEARLIRAMARRHLSAPGLVRSSLDDMLALEAELKDRTPIGVWLEIADVARQNPEIELRAAKRLAETRPDDRSRSYVNAFRAVSGAALETAAAQCLGQQTNADELVAIAHDLLDAGRLAWAREAYALATVVAPNRAPAFQGLAAAERALAAAERRSGSRPSTDPRAATAALARARDLEPGDAMLKAELAFRKNGSSTTEPGHEVLADEQYIVAPSVFLERAKRDPAKKGEIDDRQLHWVRVVTYHPDKRISQLMHYAREIVIEPRTEADLFEKQLPSEGDQTELLFARVHRKDGTVAAPEEQGVGGRRPFIRWPQLHTGDVVEVAVRSWTAGPVGRRGDAPFYFIDYVGSTDTHPIVYNEVVVDSPETSPLAIDVLNGKVERRLETKRGGRKIVRLIWDKPTMVAEEPLAPKLSSIVPVVVGSTFSSWQDFREWYRGAVEGFTEPDDQVRRLAVELTKGKKSREEKIRALFNFVADDIRYVNYVSGEWWLPNRPQELLARRQGDCDDKAMLLITLLRAIGIEASEVLVQTRYTGEPALLRSTSAAIPVFDHGIAYLPGQGGAAGIWLDATSPESRLGPLPAMDARAVALFVHEGTAKIVDTPASSPEDHGVDADWTIRLEPSGAGELVARERNTGDAAFELRTNLKEADARAQWVEQYLATGWFPTVQVKPDVAFESDLPRGAAVLQYEAHSDGLARREGQELAVPVSEISTLTSQLAPLVKRTLPVVLPPSVAPGHRNRTITIVAPPGYTFADLPPGGDEPGGEFGRAHIEFARAKGRSDAVVVKRSVVFDQSTISVDTYPKWRAWLQRVDGLMHRMVRLVPVKDKNQKDVERATK